MSIKSIVGRGFSFGSIIGDTVRSGWSPEDVTPPSLAPIIIQVVRVSDYASYAKVGQPIMIQGLNLLCPTVITDSETPGNTITDSETPGNTITNSEGYN